MKLLSLIAFLAFSFLHTSQAAQLVVKEETGESLYVYLKEVGGASKDFYPLENFDEWRKGVARWEKLPEGKYRLCLANLDSSFAYYCIILSDLTISKGANNVNIRLPAYRSINVAVKLQNIAPLRKNDLSSRFWFRVHMINNDGHRDPDYIQWLPTQLKDGIYTGPLDFLTPGTYRISAFHNDEYPKGSDLGCGLLVVTDKALEKKQTQSILIKPIEAGTKQHATRTDSKPESGDKPQPESEGSSR